MISLDLSVKISAAVPGNVSRPASFNRSKPSATLIPDTKHASLTIVGENP